MTHPNDLTAATGSSSPRLLDQVRAMIRARHYSRRTEKAYVGWIRRFILFHGKRHPREMGMDEITRSPQARGGAVQPPRPGSDSASGQAAVQLLVLSNHPL